MLWVLAQLKQRYPESLFERKNVVVADAGDRFIKAGTPGQGDIGGCHRGRFVEFEIKKPGEKQTAKQRAREEDVRRAGGIYAVVHSPTEAFSVVDPL
jgi:hypothetical protein